MLGAAWAGVAARTVADAAATATAPAARRMPVVGMELEIDKAVLLTW